MPISVIGGKTPLISGVARPPMHETPIYFAALRKGFLRTAIDAGSRQPD